MKIEILGMGCAKCQQLLDNARQAVCVLGLEAEITKVQDIERITGYGVVMTPALVVDGKVKSAGKALSIQEIQELIKE